MLYSIKISNFKAIISKEIKLEELTTVNYLVGKNGSGKSSILEAICLLKPNQIFGFHESIYNILGFKYSLSFPENAVSEFFFKYNKNKEIAIQKEPNNQFLEIKLSDSISKSTSPICPFVYEFKDIDIKRKEVSFIAHEMNLFFKSLGIDFLEGLLNYQYLNQKETNGTSFYFENGSFTDFFSNKYKDENIANIQFNNLSSGKIELLKFCLKIYECLRANSSFIKKDELKIEEELINNLNKPSTNFSKNLTGDISTIILIEEPENFLHPELQKLIPNILAKVSKVLGERIQFFVVTHSPFVISAAAKEENQKLYIIENGLCLNQNGSKNGGLKKQAIEMLGGGLEDILPKYIVFCEGEIRKGWEEKPNFQHDAKIYNYLFEDIIDVAFYSGGGKSDLEKVSSHLAGLFSKLSSEAKFIVFCDSDYLNTGTNKTSLYKSYPEPYLKRTTGSDFNNLESILYHKSVLDELKLPEFTTECQKSDKHADKYFNDNFEQIKLLDDYFHKEENRNSWKSHFEFKILTPIIKKIGKIPMAENTASIFWKLYNCIFKTA